MVTTKATSVWIALRSHHDDLNSIISEVCEKFVEQSRILEQVQNNALLALQLYPEGFDDLREAVGMELENKKAQKSLEAAYIRAS